MICKIDGPLDETTWDITMNMILGVDPLNGGAHQFVFDESRRRYVANKKKEKLDAQI